MSLSPLRAPCEWPPDLHPSSYAPLPYLTEAGSVNTKACVREANSAESQPPRLKFCGRFTQNTVLQFYSKYSLQ